jgi:catechol 2,3-dioxygenase-like lactoylglutathione lyase family enzyme
MKLRMAMIFAKDINRMLAFYRDGLGLTLVPDQSGEGWVVFVALRLASLGAKLFPPRGSGSQDVVDPEGNIFQLAGPEP